MINPIGYDHLSYVAAAYGLFAAATLYFSLAARARLALVARRLQAADPRARRAEEKTLRH